MSGAKKSFCSNCGTKVGEQKKFCPKCGKPIKPKKRRSTTPKDEKGLRTTVADMTSKYETIGGPSENANYSTVPYNKPLPPLEKKLPKKPSTVISTNSPNTSTRQKVITSPTFRSSSNATPVSSRITELEKENAELRTIIDKIKDEKSVAMKTAGQLRRQLSSKKMDIGLGDTQIEVESINREWQEKYDDLEYEKEQLEQEIKSYRSSTSSRATPMAGRKVGFKNMAPSEDLIDGAIETMRVPTVEPSELEFKELIGEGAAATVVKGYWQRTTVAIKVFKGLCSDPGVVSSFVNEVNHWNDLRHPRIVPLYGACVDKIDNICCVVMPYYSRGSLYSVLNNKEIPLPWHLRIRIAFQIASGMRLLHGRNVLHRDLKSLNVLLTNGGNALLSDFGLARQRDVAEQTRIQTNTTTQSAVVGSSFWLDPDIVAKKAKHSRRTDVYSFGITLNEIVSRKRPHAGLDQLSFVFNLASNRNFRPSIPKDCPKQVASLIERCWHSDGSKRPNFNAVTDELAEIAHEMCEEECNKLVTRLSSDPSARQDLQTVLETATHVGVDEEEWCEDAAYKLQTIKLNQVTHQPAHPTRRTPPVPSRNVPYPDESKTPTSAAAPPRLSKVMVNTPPAASRRAPSRDRASAQIDSPGGGLLTNQLLQAKEKLKKSSPGSNKKRDESGLENQLDKLLMKRRAYIEPQSQITNNTQHTITDWSSI